MAAALYEVNDNGENPELMAAAQLDAQ